MKNFKLINYNNPFISFTMQEKIILICKGLLVVLLLDYIFYRSIWAVIPLLFIGVGFIKMEQRNLLQKKREMIRNQFKELLLLASTGQKAGNSIENAILSSYDDMEFLFGIDSSICKILHILQQGKGNNVAFTKLWKQIGYESKVEELQEFACIYEIAYQSSGNMSAIMEKTASIIIQKSEVLKEIHVMLCAKRLEQKIMNMMPFAIILYINLTSPGYFDGMYHTVFGIIIMTICMILYLIAYILSVKIISISY